MTAKSKQKAAANDVANEESIKDIVESEQFDKDGNLVCPTCKKSLRGLKTNVSDSLIAPEKHTTKRRKVQCCSEECTAKFHIVQQKFLDM
jgi:3-polyprenyl-4-hydroxybenzoate decarboxylase